MDDPEIHIAPRRKMELPRTSYSWWLGADRSAFYSEMRRLFKYNKPDKPETPVKYLGEEAQKKNSIGGKRTRLLGSNVKPKDAA